MCSRSVKLGSLSDHRLSQATECILVVLVLRLLINRILFPPNDFMATLSTPMGTIATLFSDGE